jgi:hypothetical protein
MPIIGPKESICIDEVAVPLMVRPCCSWPISACCEARKHSLHLLLICRIGEPSQASPLTSSHISLTHDCHVNQVAEAIWSKEDFHTVQMSDLLQGCHIFWQHILPAALVIGKLPDRHRIQLNVN